VKFIVRGAGLGDTVALVPVLEEWRKTHPEEVFYTKTDHWQQAVFKGHPAIEQGTRRTREVWTFNAISGPAYPGNMPQFYAAQKGMWLEDPTPSMWLSNKEIEDAKGSILGLRLDSRFRGIVAISPQAGWPTRVWPLERFRELVGRLTREGLGVIEVGSSSPTPVKKTVLGTLDAHASFYDALSIRETAALIAECDLYIGNDSGLAHVAAAVGIPQVVIYGIIPWFQRAYWNTTPVISRKRCAGGCGMTCTFPAPVPPCLEEISVDEVHSRVRLAMERFVRRK
jgi:ADP-heptose:LPS heptosyltransferase